MKVVINFLGVDYEFRFTMRSMLKAMEISRIDFEKVQSNPNAIEALQFFLIYIEESAPKSIKDKEALIDELQASEPKLFKLLVSKSIESITNNLGFFSVENEALQTLQ